MSKVVQLQSGFREICMAPSVGDAVKAYADFHELLAAEPPDVDTLRGLVGGVDNGNRAIEAMASTRAVRVGVREAGRERSIPCFLGTGIMVLAVREGRDASVVAVDYVGATETTRADPVIEEYGDYQHVALRKAGQAALLAVAQERSANLGLDEDYGYWWLEERLRDNGLHTSPDSHHLGYDMLRFGSSGDFVAAGASGMLPSDSMVCAFSPRLDPIINNGRDSGLFTWERDALAGLMDEVAAEAAVHAFDGATPYFLARDITNLAVLRNQRGHNLH